MNPGAPRPASVLTAACNHAQRRLLPLADTQSFQDAQRGFIAPAPEQVLRANGRPAWNLAAYGFLAEEESPPSVHPGLWRHARVNMHTGLFKVCDSVYQVRGLDISNMTIMEGDSGLLVIDPLTSAEVARAALELYYTHRPRRPIHAVVYSHSHADHFGGVRGVIDEADVQAGRVRVIAPAGFMAEAVSENVMAGTAMLRRSVFQFGPLLPKGVLGQVDAGLGKTTSSGTVTLIPPTQVIEQPLETHTIDGIECVFELTPGAEAPAELIMFHPSLRLLNMTEISSHNFHNLLPLRGAQVRDAQAWARYLGDALERYAPHSDILIAQHHWPVWGQDAVAGFLERQRDLYKFVHDQTLRLINHGHKAPDIAEMLELPEVLQQDWSARGFYGTVRHNVKAIYQRYLGWYDGDPTQLNPLPPVAQAHKSIEYMGGAPAVLERARADFERGEYRWVAQVAGMLVRADAGLVAARELCADALEQLGYQSESATWRNAYLQGASELRNGPPNMGQAASPVDLVRAMPMDLFFDYLAVRVNGPKAAGLHLRLNWTLTDTDQGFALTLKNGVLTHRAHTLHEAPDAALCMTRQTLDQISLGQRTFPEAAASGDLRVEGRPGVLLQFLGVLDSFQRGFAVLEPLRG